MKRSFFWIAATGALLLFSGCAPRFESLTPEQKLDCYQQVGDEALAHRERGAFYERRGCLERALAEYDRANFYGEIAPVDPARLERLHNTIRQKSRGAYRRGERALSKRAYGRALREFNTVVKLDSRFSDALAKRNQLLSRPVNAEKIAADTRRLKALLSQPRPGADEKKKTEKLVDELLSYQHDHPVAYGHLMAVYEAVEQQKREGRGYLRRGRRELTANHPDAAEAAFRNARAIDATHKEGVRGLVAVQKRRDAIYLTALANNALADKNLPRAESKARKAVAADGGYAPANNLLARIVRDRARGESGERLENAREYLKNRQYTEAMEEVRVILESDPGHVKAKALSADIRRALKRDVSRLLKEGAALFDQNRFEESSQRFESVLIVEPDNNISRTYLKRIESRMKTLRMLEH